MPEAMTVEMQQMAKAWLANDPPAAPVCEIEGLRHACALAAYEAEQAAAPYPLARRFQRLMQARYWLEQVEQILRRHEKEAIDGDP